MKFDWRRLLPKLSSVQQQELRLLSVVSAICVGAALALHAEVFAILFVTLAAFCFAAARR
jgi:hypothetical protein